MEENISTVSRNLSEFQEPNDADDPEKANLKTAYIASNEIQGVIPKQLDDHERAQLMGFIAYAQNVENTVKLITFNKNLNLNEPHDKNRIFVTGNTIMSQKLSTTVASQNKVAEQLQNIKVFSEKIKRANMVDRNRRQQAMKGMRDSLNLIADLQQRYVEISEYKKVACIDIEKAFPEAKPLLPQQETQEDKENGNSEDEEANCLQINRKKRRYTNSFFNANNLIQWEENTKSPNFKLISPGNIYWYKSVLSDFENRDRKYVAQNMKTLIFETPTMLNSKSRGNIGWTSTLTPTNGSIEYEEYGPKKARHKMGGNMDLLKKFRYNFHYWLKNCYQPGDLEEQKQDIYQTQAATNQAASQIFQMSKGTATITPEQCLIQQKLKWCLHCNGENHTDTKYCEPCLVKKRSSSNLAMGQKSNTESKQEKQQKYMVIQMGQSHDEVQDQMLIQFLSQNALAVKHHPGAVQFQVSKQMLQTLKKKFANVKAVVPPGQAQKTSDSLDVGFFNNKSPVNEGVSRYSSRSRVNMTSTNKQQQQQQFINKISQQSRASLERTLVASRELRNRPQKRIQETINSLNASRFENKSVPQSIQQQINNSQKYNLDRFESLRKPQVNYYDTIQPVHPSRKLNVPSGKIQVIHQPISPMLPKNKMSLFPQGDLKRINKSGIMLKQSPFKRDYSNCANGGI